MRIPFLLLISFPLFSKENPKGSDLATLQGEPSSFIEGCVSAVTGELSFQQDDFVVRSASPITLRRRYVSLEANDPSLSWFLFYHTKVEVFSPMLTGTPLLLNAREPSGTSQQKGHMGGKPHVDIRRRGPYLERKYVLKAIK